MWLPKYERKLLSYYYRKINKVEASQYFNMEDLIKALGELKPPNFSIEMILRTYKLLENTNDLLSQRGLIKLENPSPSSISVLQELPKISKALGWTDIADIKFCITLTLEGYDLGRKYNSWLPRSGLWFAEYKDHWFWLILGFLGGIIGALIVNWLSK